MYRFLRRRGKRRDLNVLLKELWLEEGHGRPPGERGGELR